jgi:DNA-binding MarR family transcriptional regulator
LDEYMTSQLFQRIEMQTTIEELRSTLQTDPASLRSDQLMEEIFWDAFNLLTEPDRDILAEKADATSSVAREIFGRTEPHLEAWRLWYAGQLQGIAGLLRVVLGRHRLALSTTALLLGRRNAIRILKKLCAEDWNFSDLAAQTDLDDSQLGREIKELVRHNLVETAKVGRERWARITNGGRTALAEIRKVHDSDLAATFPLALAAYSREQISRMKETVNKVAMVAA